MGSNDDQIWGCLWCCSDARLDSFLTTLREENSDAGASRSGSQFLHRRDDMPVRLRGWIVSPRSSSFIRLHGLLFFSPFPSRVATPPSHLYQVNRQEAAENEIKDFFSLFFFLDTAATQFAHWLHILVPVGSSTVYPESSNTHWHTILIAKPVNTCRGRTNMCLQLIGLI